MSIKALLKTVDKRVSIPILAMINVNNGIAEATDMELYTRIPTDFANGIYGAAGYKAGVYIAEDIDPAGWPVMTDKPFNNPVEIPEHIFFDALNFASYGISNEETRYYLNGIFFDHEKNAIVATDGHRLFRAKMLLNIPYSFILPKKAVAVLMECRAKKKNDNVVKMSFSDDETKIKFELAGGVEIITKAIDGKFPTYERVIPNIEGAKTYTLNYQQWLKAYKTAKAMKTGRLVTFSHTGFGYAHDKEHYSITGMTTDYPEGYGYNAAYMADMLNAYGLEELPVYHHEATSPAVVIQGHKTSVIMPMRV